MLGSHDSVAECSKVAERPHQRPATCSSPTDESPKKKQTFNKQSFEYLWRSGVAGGLAGCVAKTVVAPLDRVKILFQSRNPLFTKYTGSWFGFGRAFIGIYQRDGVLGLFQGHSATILRIFPYAAIRFLSYEQIRAILIPSKADDTSFRRLISGSLAGVTSVLFTYPLEVIRVRLAFETGQDRRSTSFTSICKQIYHEQATSFKPAMSSNSTTTRSTIRLTTGIVNFYRGFSPTLLGMIPYAGMSFLTHDAMGDVMRHPAVAKWTCLPPSPRDALQLGKPVPLRSWAELVAGGTAGLVAQTASYPLEVIRRRMQVNGAVVVMVGGDGRLLRINETARLIFKERPGISGFFVGLTIGYVKIVPMFAVSFFVYERLKSWFGI